jgi:sugar/nucleoside kinase (ribokinase family)
MRTKQFDVLVVGDLFVDIVMSGFAVWPKPGEETFAQEMLREAGGGAAITASGLARLRARTASSGWSTEAAVMGLAYEPAKVTWVNTSTLERDHSEPTGLTAH